MDVFERDGYRLRFSEVVDGREHKFEYFWEPDDSPEGLLDAWREGDERRRFNAVYLMSQKDDERFIDTLVEASRMKDFPGRGIAISGLAKYLNISRPARRAVFAAVASGDYVLTVAGLQALSRLNNRRSKRILHRTLRHLMRRPDIKGGTNTSTPAALLALAAIESLLTLHQTETSVRALEELFQHTERPVRIQALSVATRFPESVTVETATRFLTSLVPECILAAEILVRKGDTERIETLSEYAQSPDALTRTHAVAALARIDSPGSLNALKELLRTEKDMRLRMQMLYHLKRAGYDVELAPFKDALRARSPIMRQNAITLLTRLTDSEEARSILLEHKEVEPDDFLRHQLERIR